MHLLGRSNQTLREPTGKRENNTGKILRKRSLAPPQRHLATVKMLVPGRATKNVTESLSLPLETMPSPSQPPSSTMGFGACEATGRLLTNRNPQSCEYVASGTWHSIFLTKSSSAMDSTPSLTLRTPMPTARSSCLQQTGRVFRAVLARR